MLVMCCFTLELRVIHVGKKGQLQLSFVLRQPQTPKGDAKKMSLLSLCAVI